MSRDEAALSPTYLAIGMRQQWSDEHVFMDNELRPFACDRCGMARRHPNHCTREQDRAAIKAMVDRMNGV